MYICFCLYLIIIPESIQERKHSRGLFLGPRDMQISVHRFGSEHRGVVGRGMYVFKSFLQSSGLLIWQYFNV